MDLISHILVFTLSMGILWLFGGSLVDSIDRIAKKLHKTDFMVSFFVLGILTSISEISVAFNSYINKVPEIAAGNLVGASFVLLLLIVPLLAIFGGGIILHSRIERKVIFPSLIVILLPAFFVIDGLVTDLEGGVLIVSYALFLYILAKDIKKNSSLSVPNIINEDKTKKVSLFGDIIKILIGMAFIFAAGNVLVKEAVFFSSSLGIQGSLVGLLLLSLGTNIPEITIAIGAISTKRKDIAFGNYLGSSAMNSFIFGCLAFFGGTFRTPNTGFILVASLLALGAILFYVFAKSKNKISRNEACILICFYFAFIFYEIYKSF